MNIAKFKKEHSKTLEWEINIKKRYQLIKKQ